MNTPPLKLALISIAYFPGFPPLGLASLATYLEKNLSYPISIHLIDVNYDDIQKELTSIQPDIVGISAMSIFYPTAIRLAKKIKRNHQIPVLIGGVHITTMWESLDPIFDAGIIGEGEITLLELIEKFYIHRKLSPDILSSTNGLVFFNEDQIVKSAPRALTQNLDTFPIIDRNYLNTLYFKKSADSAEFSGKIFHIITSRGCPYSCAFCSANIMWDHRVRFHSIERICDEIELGLTQYKPKVIHFIDDLFPGSTRRLAELIEHINSRIPGHDFTFQISTRATYITDDFIHQLKQLGNPMIYIGYESGNNDILRFLKGSNITVNDNYHALQTLHKHKIHHGGSFVLGNPNETIEQMKDTLRLIKYAVKKSAEYIFVFSLTPLPGTRIWETATQSGLVTKTTDWEKFDLFQNMFTGKITPMMLDSSVDPVEFQRVISKANNYARRILLKKLLYQFKHHPIQTIYQIFRNPKKLSLKTRFSSNISKGKAKQLSSES